MDMNHKKQDSLVIKKVAILGAGVMGAQIAAQCVNAGIPTLLYDLAASQGEHNAIVTKAIANLGQLKPSPLGTPQMGALLVACNYEDHLSELEGCDLIIEAIAERLDWKEALYQRISPYLSKHSILVSNTSGLSVNQLAQVLPKSHRHHLCGVHFFNPPRYMHLAELIPAEETAPELLDHLETWLTSRLGKGVVRAKDTPNFIANRIGVFSLLATLHHAEAMGLGLDEVDALTGGLLGRPKSATFRTMDVVGLDTMQHGVTTMKEQLSADPWHAAFRLPEWLCHLIQDGHLGQKSGQGIYKKQGKVIQVYDPRERGYRVANGEVADEVAAVMRLKDPKERMAQLIHLQHPQAQFLVACFRDLFHYSAYHLEAIASTVRDVDLAMRWGFGWQTGPFETWQASGLDQMRAVIEKSIQEGQAMSSAALPSWLMTTTAFYQAKGAFFPAKGVFEGLSSLPVYQRQVFRESALGQPNPSFPVMFENEGVCLWSLPNDIAVVQFKSKANTIGQSVIDGLNQALDLAERQSQGLIVYQQDANNFSSGADLKGVATLIQGNQWDALDGMISGFQALMMRLKYSAIPTVAALRGRALGGGCELSLQCASIVSAFEAYPGLVEAGVGLIPAGGGCKEMAMRAAVSASKTDLMSYIRPYFEQIATAAVASSAPDALRRGYLQPIDHWVMHTEEVLYAASAQVIAMNALNYHPPLSPLFPVAGREGHALLQVGLVNWLEGSFISQHDYFLANELARVLCGGDLNQGTLVDEAWMLRLEKEAFITLAMMPLTQARIGHLLETGKPLRN